MFSAVRVAFILASIFSQLSANALPFTLSQLNVFENLYPLNYLSTLVNSINITGFIYRTVSRGLVDDHELSHDLTFKELAAEVGLKAEEYEVKTEDGYILGLFRIKGNESRPVLLMHGILQTSEVFLTLKNTSLAKLLVDQGYDVWLGNIRGNRYSRRHITLDPVLDPAFYDFSFHECGKYDLPAIIDFILNKTGCDSLSAVGFSQGNQLFYVMGSLLDEYNKKVKVLIALAPICYVHDIEMDSMKSLFLIAPLLDILFRMFGKVSVFEDGDILKTVDDAVLFMSYPFTKGSIEKESTSTNYFIPVRPSVSSVKNGKHLVQLNKSKRFAQYDYGIEGNLAKYNSESPPDYDLSKVTMHVELIQGSNDLISTMANTKKLKQKLINSNLTLVQWEQCNHMDFLSGKLAHKYVYEPMINILGKYN